jgi:hypothetical protein
MRSEKATTPGMPTVDVPVRRTEPMVPLEPPPRRVATLASEPVARLEEPFAEPPTLDEPPLDEPSLDEPSLDEPSLDQPPPVERPLEQRLESDPAPVSLPDPVTAPRHVVDEAALVSLDEDRTSPFQVVSRAALERARTVPLDDARADLEQTYDRLERTAESAESAEAPSTQTSAEELGARGPVDDEEPIELQPDEVELTPSPPPAPAPALEEAVRSGAMKLTPVAITPMRLAARQVGEFIGENQHAAPATFGDALDASLSLSLP